MIKNFLSFKKLKDLGLLLIFCVLTLGAKAQNQPVTLTQDAESATLENGIVIAKIKKSNGNLISLRYNGIDMLSKGGGYWNIYGYSKIKENTQEKGTSPVVTITHDPAANGGDIGEVALRFPYTGQEKTVPFDIEIRYTLHRGDSGIYGWTIADHDPKYPPFNVEVSTVCFKLNPDVFDFLSIDKDRQKHMSSAEDWVKGTQLNLWEARRINTGIHAGETEHKYDYTALFSQMQAYGWSSTKRNVGLYIVNPSFEYMNGGPVGLDYGGHIDVKAALPADPTLLFIWHSPHYGGRAIQVNANERWQKIVGPFLIYCDKGANPQAMWQNALTRLDKEKKSWPYNWAIAPGYEHANERGSASGSLVVRDPQNVKATAAGAWVGLAAAPYETGASKYGPVVVDWQTDGKHYEYWVHADQSGKFTIPNARPGKYVLYAFNDGIFGEYSRADVTIEAGKTTNLGMMTWVPFRNGKQLWDIGIPNRSAAEFRHGDHYWQWGLYNLYPQEFPNDVDYIIGKSNYKTDWNYAEPPRPDGKGGYTNTTWKIEFNSQEPSKGTAVLRLAVCGARGGPVDVKLNGNSIGTTGPLPESGVMHRDGIRSAALNVYDFSFDAAALKPGNNIIELTKEARAWTDGVLYDYVRLELNDKKPFKEGN